MSSEFIGFISIFLTILIWGTWLIFSRGASKRLNNPFLENVLITFGAFLCNTLIFLIYFLFQGGDFEISFFLLPFFSGILWSFAGLFAFIACSKIGVGKAMSIWAPSGMLVSFLWGVLYYKEFSGNIISASFAIGIIIIGVISVIQIRNSEDTHKVVFSGAGFAILSSMIWGGTYLIPIKELSSQVSPFITLLPLSIGMCVGSLGILIGKRNTQYLNYESIKNGYLIVLSGFMWAVGNMFAIIVVINIGIGKAYPLAELCGIINAFFAVFFLKEIVDFKKIYLFLLASLVSFLGAIWLSFIKI